MSLQAIPLAGGMGAEESWPLRDYLRKHSIKPMFTCRLHWRPGTLAVLDNRCVQHMMINDYPGQRLALHQITIHCEHTL